MEHEKYFLVLDVGTSGIKALIFTEKLKCIQRSHKPIQRFFPFPKFVEQDPEELVKTSVFVIRDAVEKAKIDPKDIISIGITNQRETTILWDKITGKPVYNAIVWEDSRTEDICKNLNKYEEVVRLHTGLTILPYFSATKVFWILENAPKAKEVLKNNNLLFGTVDTWILWNLTKEKNHTTDLTNASRTLLFNNKTLSWDEELLKIFSVPKNILPDVFPSQHVFGTLKKDILKEEISVQAMCGDQQSSLYGIGVEKGETKITYGTGTFIMQAIGKDFMIHKDFFTTLIPYERSFAYALEAKIDDSGAQIEKVLHNKEKLQKKIDEIAKEVSQVVEELPVKPSVIIVDGGITREKYLLKKQEDLLGIKVLQNKIFDGTALGTAKLLKDSL